jgi:outer membrane protein assembly factor BamB
MAPARSRQVRRAEARRAQARGASKGGGPRPPWRGEGGGPLGRIPRAAWLATAAIVVLVAAAVVLTSLLSSSSPSPELALLDGSGYPNVDASNTRYVGGPIDSATASKLAVAWTLPLTAKSEYGSYSSAPVIANGIVYSQDLASNVQAISLKTGKVLWTKTYNEPDQGPNGVVVAGGRVYGATQTQAFALDERTGAQVWSVTLVRNEREGIDMAPGYHDGIVYVSTVPDTVREQYGGGGVGILWALDAASGRRLWHFDTAPEDLWSSEHREVNAGGGLWYPPAFDQSGSMYIGTGNPAPFPGTSEDPWGSSRPGPNLYTDSIVKLNARTGAVQWYYQLTPHDLYDHDLQDPPILASVHGRRAVIAAGKGGFVLALDAATGKLLWKRSVGIHNGHDEDSVYAMRHEYSKLSLPETVYPGLLGGVIAPMASNGSTVFVPVVNHSVTFDSQTEPQESGPSTGELVALSVDTGAVRWDRKLPSSAFGAATAVNDVVFATTFEGKLYGFDANSGGVVWETQLPAATNTGVAVDGDTLIAPAGVALAQGQSPQLVAYRLPSSVASQRQP